MDKKLKGIFAGCYYAYFVCGMLTLILGAVMPMILTEYNLGYDKGGMLLSFHSMGNLLASFFTGMIAIYLGRKNTIVLLSSAAVFVFGGIVLAKSPAVLMVMFLLTGISRGSIGNINNSLINDLVDGNPGPLNLLHTFFAIGAFVAPFLTSWYITMGLGWKYTMATMGVLSVIMVVVYGKLKIDNNTGKIADNKASFDFLKNINYYIAGGIVFFFVGTETAINGWLVTYLQNTGLASTSLAQTFLSILWIVIIIGRLFCAYISQRVDKKMILVASSFGTLVFFALFMLSSSTWTIAGCIIGLGFCLAGIFPTTVADVGDLIKGSDFGMGILLAISGLGGIVTPYITGIVAEKSGIVWGMLTIIGSILLMLFFTVINKLRKPKEKPSLDPQ